MLTRSALLVAGVALLSASPARAMTRDQANDLSAQRVVDYGFELAATQDASVVLGKCQLSRSRRMAWCGGHATTPGRREAFVIVVRQRGRKLFTRLVHGAVQSTG